MTAPANNEQNNAFDPARSPDGPFRLNGKVALVTGASSGLGMRCARVFHHAGANVVAAARRLDRLKGLAVECPGLVPTRCDVTESTDLDQVVSDTIARHGRIDVLVNNAGTLAPTSTFDQTIEQFRRVLDVNLVATFQLTQLVAHHMREAGLGSIINVASVHGLVAGLPPGNPSYTASKGAVVNLTRDLAATLAEHGVRVNAVAPGYFRTELTSFLDDDGAAAIVRKNIPMRRFGGDHELDGVLLFLASDASTYCTGQVIAVDGGWTAR